MRAAALPLLLAPAAASGAIPALRDIAQRASPGVFIGSAFQYGVLYNQTTGSDSAQYRMMHSTQYSLSTAYCGWSATERQQGVFTMDTCVASVKYAAGAKQAFRGHNLCWNLDTFNPAFLNNMSAAEMPAALRAHISYVVSAMQAAGEVYSWDVVNEAVLDNGKGLKSGTWYPKVPDYIDQAFTFARAAAAPAAKLFYNDYNWIQGGAKADAVLALAAGMQQRGVPIDGLGMQGHLKLSKVGDDVAAFGAKANRTIGRAAALGLEVHITEMDVACDVDGCDPLTPARLEQQAQVYVAVLRACLAHPRCRSYETWGFTDAHTWLYPRKYPKNPHPLPFDEDYAPKPAFWAIVGVLNGTTA